MAETSSSARPLALNPECFLLNSPPAESRDVSKEACWPVADGRPGTRRADFLASESSAHTSATVSNDLVALGQRCSRRATALEQKVIASNFEIIYGSGEGAAVGIVEEYDNLLLEGTSSSSGTVLQGVFQLIQSLVKTRRENQTSAPDSAREKSFLLAGTPARWCAWDHFQHAFLCQAYALMDATATDASHDLCWGWPVLGVPEPEGRSFDSVGRAGASSTRGAQRRIGSASGSKFASGWSSADWKPGSQDRDRVSSRSRGQSSHGSSPYLSKKRGKRGRRRPQRDANAVPQPPWFASCGSGHSPEVGTCGLLSCLNGDDVCLSFSASLCLSDPETQFTTRGSTSCLTTGTLSGCNDESGSCRFEIWWLERSPNARWFSFESGCSPWVPRRSWFILW